MSPPRNTQPNLEPNTMTDIDNLSDEPLSRRIRRSRPVPVSEEDYLEACESNSGWCTSCEDFTGDFCEPDAREYYCPECEQNTCYGAEQALIELLITFK